MKNKCKMTLSEKHYWVSTPTGETRWNDLYKETEVYYMDKCFGCGAVNDKVKTVRTKYK